MKVVLTAINAKYIHSNLALRYLKAYTEDLDYDCQIKEFSINDMEDRVLEEIMKEKPDVIGFSCYIWNIGFITRISKLIKLIDSKIQIMYGGPEVSYECESFLRENDVDYIVEGEGEETFREFILYKLRKKKVDEIKGFYYKENKCDEDINLVRYNGAKKPMNFNDVIFPYSHDEFFENKIIYYEASRGCPFNCKYCLSSVEQGVRFLEVERVKKELQFFMDRKVRLVKFVDRTFNCSSKFAGDIWNFLISADTQTTFHFEISADILRIAEIEVLKNAPKGRIQFEVGVQTTNDEVLKNINRNIKFETISSKVKSIRDNENIKQHLDLIAGLPGENFESFKKSFNDVHSLQPEEIQLGFLKLLKGSSMREEAEKWGIVYSPYAPYEVLRTKDISYEELVILKKVEEMVDKYYNSQKFKTILKYFSQYFPSPFDFYLILADFFYKKGYFSRNISNADYYKVFLEFNEEKLQEDNLFIGEIIKYDYLKFNKKKWLPDFLWREWNKKVENELKGRLIEEDKLTDLDKVHIEKFRVDIFQFIKNGRLEAVDKYYLFLVENNDKVSDISDLCFR
jgi:radical SAM superfamily enzyme YgiQ (UPF0313 family)